MQSTKFEKDLAAIRQVVFSGSRSGIWFAQAFVSWYWGGDAWQVSLIGYLRLDDKNKKIFARMLDLRGCDGWKAAPLQELAEAVTQKWNLKPLHFE